MSEALCVLPVQHVVCLISAQIMVNTLALYTKMLTKRTVISVHTKRAMFCE